MGGSRSSLRIVEVDSAIRRLAKSGRHEGSVGVAAAGVAATTSPLAPFPSHRIAESTSPPPTVLALVCLAWLGLAACERGYVETGDLPELRQRGNVRVLVPRRGEAEVLPRHGHPFDHELELALSFAADLGLDAERVWVDEHEELIPALLEGRGDLIAAHLTVTAEREERIDFSAPVGWVREQVVTRSADSTIRAPADLVGRRVAVRRSSSYWQTLAELQAEHPGIELVAAPEEMDTEEILHGVAAGRFDVSAADDNLAAEVLAYTPGLRVAFDLTGERPVAWGLRPGSPRLRAALNRFVERQRLGGRRPRRYRDDLPGIRERGVLRVLTRNSATTYFIWRGRLVGFEFDLARRFARELGLRIEIVVAPDRAALLSWLRQGRGDLVAAGLTITERRVERGIAFSRPYHFVQPMVVAPAADTALGAPAELAGRTVTVRRSSAYWDPLDELRRQGIELELTAAPETLETEEIIGRVADGSYDLTVADSHIIDVELAWRDDVRAAFPVGDSVAHGWAVRGGDRELLAAVDDFFQREYRGLFYNITYNKYFRNPASIRQRAAERPARTGTLSPYDSLFQRYARRYDFDWRLIAAQAYQESRFRPAARSFAGAVGLMQVMPGTARELGFESSLDPESSVHAGVMYLRQLYDRLDELSSPVERTWFALAAYNAGFGHLRDARRLAAELGRDPDRWFGEVEAVMPLLARARYYRQARFGYCRCGEPVAYVRAIRDRYRGYSGSVSRGSGEQEYDNQYEQE